jgi:hypothetical protein
VPAQSHIVGVEELHAAVAAASQVRQKQRQTILSVLSTKHGEKALRTARMDLRLVETAVAALSDDELSRLSERAAKAQADFAGGRLTERDLLLILLGIAALILIIVAVD